MTLGNGLSVDRSYDLLFQLDTSQVSETVLDLDYDYFANGIVESILDIGDSPRDQSFSYDDLDRLEIATGIYANIGYS